MIVHTWDEIDEVWSTHELPIESKDPVEINKALGSLLTNDGEGDGWEVESSCWSGPVLTIETRSDRNHLAVIVFIDGHYTFR